MKTIRQKNIELYESLYQDDTTSSSYEVRSKVEFIKKHLPLLPKNSKVLEVGYGAGDLLHCISQYYISSVAYGIEVVDEARKLYSRKFVSDKNVILKTSDAEGELLFKDNSFDLVVSSHLLEHIRNEQALLADMIRILKKDGILIIVVPEWESGDNHLHYRQYSKARLEKIAQRYKLDLINLRSDGYYLNKLFYRILNIVLNKKEYGVIMDRSETSLENTTIPFAKRLYYKFGVSLLLVMNRIDTLLFKVFDKRPMQWMAIYKK